MTIISISYFALIALSLIIYYIVPKKAQWIVLLLTSLVFFYFAGTPWTIVYLIAGILITWLATFRINQIRNSGDKYNEKQVSVRCRAWLIIALILDLGMLASLKYMNFLLSNASRIYNIFAVNNVSWSVNWPAALGISFYTLQIVGYLLDCYWGVVEVQKNPLRLALFTSFFPQMVSGPISRYGQLQDELERPHKFNFNNVMSGATRIAVGLFKKVILAEGVAYFIPIFQNSNTRIAGIYALIALLLYVVRIFADFAGCMDIVIGTAKCFGITMVENFNSPFTSKTIQEFWQRWHITLGLWLRDYIMYPILRTKTWSKMTKKLKEKHSKRVAKLIPTHLAMLVLWFFMGLWHGGGWNFILEGLWFWSVIVIAEWCAPLFKKTTSKIDKENSFYVLFQRLRTIMIYAIGALMFKCLSLSLFWTEFANIFFKLDTYLVFVAAILYCTVGYFVEKFLIKKNVKPSTISMLATMCHFVVLLSVIGFFGTRFEGEVWGNLVIVSVAYIIFLILALIEKKDGSLANRVEGRPIMYRVLIIVLLIYVVIIFGYYGEGYNPADFIYGGF